MFQRTAASPANDPASPAQQVQRNLAPEAKQPWLLYSASLRIQVPRRLLRAWRSSGLRRRPRQQGDPEEPALSRNVLVLEGPGSVFEKGSFDLCATKWVWGVLSAGNGNQAVLVGLVSGCGWENLGWTCRTRRRQNGPAAHSVAPGSWDVSEVLMYSVCAAASKTREHQAPPPPPRPIYRRSREEQSVSAPGPTPG
jgi:hypothetical protein